MVCREWLLGYTSAVLNSFTISAVVCREWLLGYTGTDLFTSGTMLWFAGNGYSDTLRRARRIQSAELWFAGNGYSDTLPQVPADYSPRAVVCREWLLGYTQFSSLSSINRAVVCREWLLGYTTSTTLLRLNLAVVCREWLLGYTDNDQFS